MAKKDIELAVLHPQALQDIHDRNAAHSAKLVARANEAELRARDAETEAGVRTEGQRDAIRRVSEQIRYSPSLYPWMRAYAEWMTLECIEKPRWVQRTTKARLLARSPITQSHLKLLEARPDFISYVRDLEAGPLERARSRFAASFPEYVDAHKEALDSARDANDYAAVARIAEPVLDRIMPKKAEGGVATSVTVVLAPEQLKAIATYAAPEVEAAEVVVEPVET